MPGSFFETQLELWEKMGCDPSKDKTYSKFHLHYSLLIKKNKYLEYKKGNYQLEEGFLCDPIKSKGKFYSFKFIFKKNTKNDSNFEYFILKTQKYGKF
jgi:hypothetical protein